VHGHSNPWEVLPITIERILVEAPQILTYVMAFVQAEHRQQYACKPGQFNMLYVPGIGEAAISIAGYDQQHGRIRHTIRNVGAVTDAIARGGLQMSLGLRGPFGSSWPVDLFQAKAPPRDLIIAAGGVGLAPLRLMIHYVMEQRHLFGNVTLLIGARTPDDMLYRSEVDQWRAANLHVERTVDRPGATWKEHVGVVTVLLERLQLPNPQATWVMTCGPEVMMRYVAKSAMDRGIPEQNIWVTLERNMNCAIGLCGHCQMGPVFLCKEGPVFRYDSVRQWLAVRDL
jgi:NAD(P)H-flavin reductase